MVFQELINGKMDGIEDELEPMYEEMSKHIALQRKRLGGNMAIAQAVFSRGQRERIGKMIGPDLVFGLDGLHRKRGPMSRGQSFVILRLSQSR